MKKRIMHAIKKYNLIAPGNTLVAAVSGGPDSIAMLHVLSELLRAWRVRIHVAHFNHMFRGAEAEEEALFVENIAFAMGLECTVEAHDVPQYLKETGLSPEEGARYLRYDFLNRVAKSINADVISTAHHANDQAETVLLHLLRGAGPEGLAAISPREGMLIRPMLGITKEEILAYCQKNNLEYRWDSSNNESIYTRNQVRLNLIPYLEQFNPQIVQALVRTADICRQENQLLLDFTQSAKEEVSVTLDTQKVSLDQTKIKLFHPALQRRIIRQIIDDFTGTQGYLSFDHTEEILELKPGKKLSLPGPLYARLEGGKLIFSKEKPSCRDIGAIDPVLLNIPGITYVPELDTEISVKVVNWPDPSFSRGRYTRAFNVKVLNRPLTLRNRRPGDRFRPKGLKGRKKLKDFFIDEKVSPLERDRIPILLSGDEIIWVVGYRIGEGTEVSPEDTKAVIITLKSYFGINSIV